MLRLGSGQVLTSSKHPHLEYWCSLSCQQISLKTCNPTIIVLSVPMAFVLLGVMVMDRCGFPTLQPVQTCSADAPVSWSLVPLFCALSSGTKRGPRVLPHDFAGLSSWTFSVTGMVWMVCSTWKRTIVSCTLWSFVGVDAPCKPWWWSFQAVPLSLRQFGNVTDVRNQGRLLDTCYVTKGLFYDRAWSICCASVLSGEAVVCDHFSSHLSLQPVH